MMFYTLLNTPEFPFPTGVSYRVCPQDEAVLSRTRNTAAKPRRGHLTLGQRSKSG